MYVQNNDVTFFDSFRVEHILKEIRTFIGNKNIKTNIFRIQAYDSIICGYKSLEDSGLLWKGVSETIQNEATEQKGGFLSMLLGTLVQV